MDQCAMLAFVGEKSQALRVDYSSSADQYVRFAYGWTKLIHKPL